MAIMSDGMDFALSFRFFYSPPATAAMDSEGRDLLFNRKHFTEVWVSLFLVIEFCILRMHPTEYTFTNSSVYNRNSLLDSAAKEKNGFHEWGEDLEGV